MGPSWRRAVAPWVLLLATTVLAVSANSHGSIAAAGDAPVMIVSGDIDGCGRGEDTAELVAATSGPIATVGDNAYPTATASDLARCYAPTWGAFKDRTHPVPGNHDYDASNARPYFDYFGAAAGAANRGWYSYNVGSWHVVALNSNCSDVDCEDETEWLVSDLVANPSACIMAYWHHPRFSSGTSGGDSGVGSFWKVLYEHGATLVLNGHDHDYERFAPMDPNGRRDPAKGIREFIVGTGGATLGSFAGSAPNSEVRNNDAYGVLQLTLRPDGYDWRFLPVAGDKFTDSGSDTCKGTAPATPPTTAAPLPPPTSPLEVPPSSVAPTTVPSAPPPSTSGSSPRPSGRSTTPTSRRPVANFDRPRSTPSTSPPTTKASPTTSVTAATIAAAPPPVVPVTSPAATHPPAAPGPSILSATSLPYRTDPPAGGEALPMEIAGLMHPVGDDHASRGGPALFALALLAADGLALMAIRQRRITVN